MKAAKIVAFVLGGIVLLVLLVGAVALLPSVQTWAVRRAVASKPGVKIEVSRVAAGFSAAEIRDLRVVQDGRVITAKSVTAKYSAMDYLFKKRLNADHLTIEDLVIDLRAATSPAAGESAGSAGISPQDRRGADAGKNAGSVRANAAKSTPSSFQGALAQAHLPFDVRIARVSAQGRALLPGEKVVVFDLQGAGIESGQRGKLDWKADFTDPQADATLSAARLVGTTSIHITGDRRVDLVELDATVSAHGPKLPSDQLKLHAKAQQAAAGADEIYAITLALVRGAQIEPLLKSAAEFRSATRDFAGTWELALRTEQLAAVLAGLGWPEVAARGSGKFSFQPQTGAASASGELQGNLFQLEKLAPELAKIGAVQFHTRFDGGLADNTAQLERFQLDVTGVDGKKIAEIATLQRIGIRLADQRVTLADSKAELARISVQALPLAWAQPFLKGMTIDSGDVSLALAVEAEADGSRIRARAREPLVVRAVTVRSGDKKLVDQVTLSAHPRIDYSANRIIAELAELKVSMPAGDALSGLISADVTGLTKAPVIAFTSQLQARLVEAHRPYLPVDTGPLAVVSNLEGRLAGDVFQLGKLSTTVKREGGAMLAVVELQQPLTANLKAGTFTVPKPEATVARVQLGEVPLAWAEPFVAKSKLAGSLAGASLDVTCRSVDDLTFTTVEPLLLRGVTATLDGKAMVHSLDLMADLTATKRKDVIAYDLRRLEVKQGNALLAGLTVAGTANLGKKFSLAAKGALEADAAALMNQPALIPFAALSRGRLTSTFEANMADAIQARVVLAARGLVAREKNQPLGDLEVSLNANVKPDGSGTLTAPITLTNGNRHSDVSLDGTFGKTSDQKSFLFSGKISSTQLFVDDFQPLAGIAPAGEKPAAPTAPKPGRDTAPFWKGVQGKVALDLKKVVYGKDYTISNVRGSATITDSRLALDGLAGLFNQNPFKANAAVVFNPQQPKPYTLTGSSDVENLDVGEILRAANPNEKPAFESRMSVKADLNGNGATLADLGNNVYGRFDLTGSPGVTRFLGRKGNTGQVVDIASSIIGALGAARGSDTTVAVAELARFLNEIRFDSLKLQVERAADLSFKVTSMEIISPLLRTMGSGAVAHRGTGAVQNQPMEILLQLGAKGELAHLFNRIPGLLGQKQDERGYQLVTRTFTIGGTPAKPDSSSFWKIIATEAARQGIPALQNLLNRGE